MTNETADTSTQLVGTSQSALFANVAARTVRGMLLPYGEASRLSVSGAEPISFERGTVKLPRDAKALNANIAHDRFKPAARFESIEDTDAGLVATFAVHDTEEGDELLAGIESGRLTRLSAEVRDLVRKGAAAVSSVLSGAAFVPEGAFASAALFAIGDVTEAEPEDDDAPTIQRGEDTAAQTPDAAPAEDNTESESVTMTDSIVPDGAVTPEVKPTDAKALSAAFAAYTTSRNPEVLQPLAQRGAGDLFAISNVQHSGPSAVTIGADTQRPQYEGEIWTRKAYERKYTPLFTNKALTGYKVTAWKWDPAAEPAVAAYAGNSAEIPSNAVDTIPVTIDALRVAGGHRIDRRFLDFGDQEVIESYLIKMAESYAKVTDAAVLAAAVAGATAMNSSAATLPAGVAPGLGAVVRGALAVIAADNTPSFAIVNPALWEAVALTGNKDTLGYLSASVGLESGSLDGFRIIPGAVAANKVLVGAKEALSFFELGGSPIRVDAIAPHHGSIDEALYGYYATNVNNAAGLQLVTTVA